MRPQCRYLVVVASLATLGWHGAALSQNTDISPSAEAEEERVAPDVEINDTDPQQALERQFNLERPELAGVIVNRTMTMAGKTFYRTFAQVSMQNPVLNGVVLTVHERPDPRWGSQLWITEGSTVHFRTQLTPRISEADRNAREAVDIVQERIISARVSSALQPSPDLADKEL